LYGYLLLASRILEEPAEFSGPWNFGPGQNASRTTRELAEGMIREWGSGCITEDKNSSSFYETGILALNISKAADFLGWEPQLSFDRSVSITASWYKAQHEDADMKGYTEMQISEYEGLLQ
jgi:CDP-glucose 4,6-dehydratase